MEIIIEEKTEGRKSENSTWCIKTEQRCKERKLMSTVRLLQIIELRKRSMETDNK